MFTTLTILPYQGPRSLHAISFTRNPDEWEDGTGQRDQDDMSEVKVSPAVNQGITCPRFMVDIMESWTATVVIFHY